MGRILIGERCEVVVGRGLPRPLLPERPRREAVAVLYQPSVQPIAERVVDLLGEDVRVVNRAVPDRDRVKEMAEVTDIYRWLVEHNLGRQDTIVGVGGGALTDAAGFVAATWMRGIESVLVPTTLLGAVDAAIGGKTAINLRLGERGGLAKNLVGAFWEPSRVVVDLDVLEQLGPELLTEGAAEVLKAGLIGNAHIVESYARHGLDAPLDELVPKAISVKAAVVGDDPRETTGRRAILNFGHTIGHAIEGTTGMPHGHAVAVGMVAEGLISHRRYGFDHVWLADLIFRLGLPVAAAGASLPAAMELIERDKKRGAEGAHVVLLEAIGSARVEVVSPAELEDALRFVGVE